MFSALEENFPYNPIELIYIKNKNLLYITIIIFNLIVCAKHKKINKFASGHSLMATTVDKLDLVTEAYSHYLKF